MVYKFIILYQFFLIINIENNRLKQLQIYSLWRLQQLLAIGMI